MTDKWYDRRDKLPQEGIEVKTKVDDPLGLRLEQTLVYLDKRWYKPDMSMMVYYQPTHWAYTDPHVWRDEEKK